MALLDRLTGEESPRIGIHGFQACLREYARGQLTKGSIATNYGIDPADTQGQALLDLIDAAVGVDAKLEKVNEINDVLTIHEGNDSNGLYPTKTDVRVRLLGA